MNRLDLAGKLQIASLPEAEYDFQGPDGGTFNIAYPEVKVGLKLTLEAGVREEKNDGWIVVSCGSKPVDLKDGLRLLALAYEERSMTNQQVIQDASRRAPESLSVPLNDVLASTLDPNQTEPVLLLEHSAEVQSASVPSEPTGELKNGQFTPFFNEEDVETVMVHYLGTHLLKCLRGLDPATEDAFAAMVKDDT